jgi:hypothetical protein
MTFGNLSGIFSLSSGGNAVIIDRDSLHQFSIAIFYYSAPGIVVSDSVAVINL